MKHKLVLLILIISQSFFSHSQETKALFLGNSYTAYNQLPQIVAEIAENMGDELIVDSNTPGGYTFNGHTTNSNTISKIEEGGWDFVFLQEQSQLPSFPQTQFETESLPYALSLNEMIIESNPCAETVFYMTWGREDGDASNCEFWPPVCTYEGMDDLLAESYLDMGEQANALVSPVGKVWRWIRQNHPEVDLYASDGSHPSAAGSYAAAVAHYVTMFRNDPELITFDYSLTPEVAIIIRTAVNLVLYEDMSTYYIGNYDLLASFDSIGNVQEDSFDLINTSSNATEYIWSINGEEYNSEDVTVIPNGEAIPVILTAINSCDTVSTEQIIISLISTVDEKEKANSLVFPNPTGGIVNFNQPVSNIRVYAPTGNLVAQQNKLSSIINLQEHVSGEYVLRFEENGREVSLIIIKE